jgi:hypothetical protein
MGVVVTTSTNKSTANAPTSIGVTGLSPGVGDLLLFAVVATSSGTPTISSPGGSWQQVFNLSKSTLAYALFALYNYASGVSSITSNLATTTAGGAVCAFHDVSGLGNNQALDLETDGSQATTSVPWPSISNVGYVNELLYYSVGRIASTYTPNNTWEWTGDFGAVVSTGSTTNAQLDGYFALMPQEFSQPQGGGNLSSAVASYLGYARFNHSADFPLSFVESPAGGNAGLYVPQFNCGMIGG